MVRRALIFDLDDTLYPEVEYVHSGFLAVAEELERRLGLPAAVTSRDLDRLFELGPPNEVFDRWLEQHGLFSAELLDLMVATYRLHDPRLRLFCDAQWILGSLAGQWKLALLTDGRSIAQWGKIRALGIEHVFETLLVTDELDASYRKPSSRGFELLLERLRVSPQCAIYVGDNPLKDFLGPRQMGMATVRVRRRCGIYHEAEPPGAAHASDAEVGSLFELPELLTKLIP